MKNMNFYLAPMEGVTGYVYRNVYNKHFHNIDKYVTPFIAPGEHKAFKSKELRDVAPQNNVGMNTTVQMLTNNADAFIITARRMKEFGYTEVNLNLGCPSGTVVSKYKGSGFLAIPDKLDIFLDKVFTELDGEIDISLKTRLGRDASEEFEDLLYIYGKYPVSELIIHPRIQKQLYKGTPDMECFSKAVEYMKEKNPQIKLVYNGDIFTKQAYVSFCESFPMIDNVMLGRGIIANPGLVDYLKEGKALTNEKLKGFYYDLLEGYRLEIQGDKNVCFKMKELWFYMVNSFDDKERCWRYVKKADSLMEINAAADKIFKEHELVMEQGFRL